MSMVKAVMDDMEIALAMSKLVHDECKDVPHDIGLRLFDLVRAARKKAPWSVTGWRPHTDPPPSAPGTSASHEILMFNAYASDTGYRFGYYDRGHWYGATGGLGGITHWMPLPERPNADR
jgi:hypothetical protein